jgi:hypothetical protein
MTVAIAIALAAVVVGIFGVTPDGTGFLQGLDSSVSRTLHVDAWHPDTLTRVLGSPTFVGATGFVVLLVLWSTGRRTNRAAVGCAATTLLAGVTAGVVGMMVRRPSPGRIGDLAAKDVQSFPSVSVAIAAGLAVALVQSAQGRLDRRRTTVAAIAALIVLIALRLMTAASWPLDDVAGLAIGAIIGRHPSRRAHRSFTAVDRRRGVTRTVAALIGVALLIFPGRSYAQILTAPGNATVDQRTVEWLRDSGLGTLVDRAESWWLWRHLPSPTATITELPTPPAPGLPTVPAAVLPPLVPHAIVPSLPGEGRWTIVSAAPNGVAQIATTYFRPDPDHPSLVAAAAWINTSTTRLTLIAGTRQPGGGPGPAGGHVPPTSRDSLIAAFNSGYKLKDTPGGALIEGRQTRAMVDGLATLAIDSDGVATVGEWGADVSAAGGFTGLRQNLHLMVADGAPVDGVSTNAGGRWGSVRNALPTWRSGLGVTATGDIVYVAGDNLTLGVLADALIAAGARVAMELDIHRGMVSFNLFTHDPDLSGHKLLPNMTRSADRYLSTDWRDFIMVTAR